MEFSKALDGYIEKVNELQKKYWKDNGYIHTPCPAIVAQPATKFIKLYIEDDKIKNIFGFIEKSTGNIYKAASFKVPAKHSRGNIFSDSNGMESICQDYGFPSIRYLK